MSYHPAKDQPTNRLLEVLRKIAGLRQEVIVQRRFEEGLIGVPIEDPDQARFLADLTEAEAPYVAELLRRGDSGSYRNGGSHA